MGASTVFRRLQRIHHGKMCRDCGAIPGEPHAHECRRPSMSRKPRDPVSRRFKRKYAEEIRAARAVCRLFERIAEFVSPVRP